MREVVGAPGNRVGYGNCLIQGDVCIDGQMGEGFCSLCGVVRINCSLWRL